MWNANNCFEAAHTAGRPASHLLWLVPSVVACLVACASEQKTPTSPTQQTVGVGTLASLEAKIEPKSGSSVTGVATFTVAPGGVRVEVTIHGATPGQHGIHVHETGDCSADDGSSAGGHFNPEGHPHALPPTGARHLGDLGNIDVDADGNGSLTFLVEHADLGDDGMSLAGHAIIVHAQPDDGSQPTGAAGARVGCGVLEPVK